MLKLKDLVKLSGQPEDRVLDFLRKLEKNGVIRRDRKKRIYVFAHDGREFVQAQEY